MTLNQTLTALGYTTRSGGGLYAKEILSAAGEVVFTGGAGDVWGWLRATGQIGQVTP